jgi:hypothetical protein
MTKYHYIFIVIIISLTACRGLRLNGPVTDYPESPVAFYDSLQANNQENFETYSGRASVTYETPKEKLSLRVNFRMMRDSVIWASISPGLGIELVRLIITKDTIMLLNRIDKTVFVKRFADIQSLIQAEVSYADFEALIIGSPISLDANNGFVYKIEKAGFLSNYSEKSLKRIERQKETPIVVLRSLEIGQHNWLMSQELNDILQNRSIKVSYLERDNMGHGKTFIKRTNIKTFIKGKLAQTIDIKWSKPKLNDPLRIKFSVPDNYEIRN